MDDRALLEAAAEAAGMDVLWPVMREGATPFAMLASSIANTAPTFWSPLTDDGDALRLAVKRGFQLDIETACGVVGIGLIRETFQHDDHEAACAATRRCIVRAAAMAPAPTGEAR